jgi:hypothetical protein
MICAALVLSALMHSRTAFGDHDSSCEALVVQNDQVRRLRSLGDTNAVTRPVSDHPYIRETVFRSTEAQHVINHSHGSRVIELPDHFFDGGFEE